MSMHSDVVNEDTEQKTEKLKIGFYWAASCGGCEIAVLDINEKILDVVAIADIVFWPVAIDIKYKDIEVMEDESIDILFFNGGIRTSENEHLAKLLRKKSKLLVAFGSCACEGGIPGLANLSSKDEIFKTIYVDSVSTKNSSNLYPHTSTKVKEGELTLPTFNSRLKTLDQIVNVDYYLPGCPPPTSLIENAIEAIKSGELPPKGTILAPMRAVCDECTREKKDKMVKEFKRIYDFEPDPNLCFLNQGIICMGIATRGGCNASCLQANGPCTGCGGPTPDAKDQGMKMLSAIASMAGLEDEGNLTEDELQKLLDQIKDPTGSFYMYSLANSFLKRRVIK